MHQLISDDDVAAFARVVHARRSIRAFLDEPVALETIVEALALAQRAPSNCNVQPWVVHIVSGAAADRLRNAMHNVAVTGTASCPDLPVKNRYEGIYRDRQIGAAKALFAATGVERNDLDGRRQATLRNYRFFDAPHAMLMFLPECFNVREAVDCGHFAQTFMLALAARGIGSCAQGALSHYPDITRKILGVSEQNKLLFGIAFGYPDPRHPANEARTDRVSLEASAVFHVD